MKIPCKRGCPGRNETCHSQCEEYLKYAAENERRRKDRMEQHKAIDYMANEIRKSKRK